MISIIILAYNSASFIASTINSVLRDRVDNDLEIIIIDNASADSTYKEIERRYSRVPGLVVKRSERNLGFAGGNNAAAQLAKGDVLLFLNDDCELEPGALQGIRCDFAEDAKLGVVQCGLTNSDGDHWESLGHFIDTWGLIHEVAHMSPRESLFPNGQQVFAGKGAALAVRHEVFDVVDGFDTTYGFLFEETDLCWRVLLMGFKVAVSGRAVARHKAMARYFGSYSGREGSAFYMLTRNRLRSMLKNLSRGKLVTSISGNCVAMFAYALRESFSKHPEVLWDFIRAVWWNVRMWRSTSAARKQIQESRLVSDRELIAAGRIYRLSLSRLLRHPAMQPGHVHA